MNRPYLLVLFLSLLALPLAAAPAVSTLNPPLAPAPGNTVSSLTSISVTFSEAVSGVDADDLLINGDAATGLTGSGAGPYVFTFTQPPPGVVNVAWDFDHGIAGLGSGAFVPTGPWSYQLNDTLAPTIGKITTSQAGVGVLDAIVPLPTSTVGTLTQTEVTFSESVTGVDAADLLVSDSVNLNVPATGVTGSGAGPYIFTFAQPAVGTVTFSWVAGHGIVDSAANAFAGGSWTVTRSATGTGTVIINEFLAANATGLLDENADNSDWIELYNSGATAVNLAGWSLSNDADTPGMWILPARTLNAGAYLIIFASSKDRRPVSGNLHTNFTLNSNGGYLALYSPQSPRVAASLFPPNYNPLGVPPVTDYPSQRYNYSYGPQTGGALRFFATPTPGAANGASALTTVTPKPNASVGRGFFKDPFSVILTCTDATATVRYTLDGSDPIASSAAYTTPLNVSTTTVLRIAAFSPTAVPSETATHSYIFPDAVLNQPSPPYDNPAIGTDDANPKLPTVSSVPVASGGAQFPVTWGTGISGGAILITNITAGQVPATYGMEPDVINDPLKYDDTGAINNVTGKLNRDRLKQGLRDLPMMSVVMKNDDMFGASGLYPNSQQKGTNYEKPCSVELLMPDGTTGFSTTCGIRIHGNASRAPSSEPKHGFKLNFKGAFGASSLGYALFPDSPVKQFDDIILRADYNSSWTHSDGANQRPKGTRIRDAFSKDTFRAMGRMAGHSRFVNLFINGIYWGIYDPTEQENNGFAAAYFGGDKNDYAVYEQSPTIKSGVDTPLPGDAQAPYTMLASNLPSATTSAIYEQWKRYLDMPEFIDYMLLHFWIGHQDWGDVVDKNWAAARNSKTGGTFKYFPWDMESLMWDQTVDRTGVTAPATGIHPKLVSNPQYLLDFADRVNKHMLAADGALLPAASIARWNKWQAILTNAMACESARWGDYRRDIHQFSIAPYSLNTWNGTFITETNRLKNTWFPNRNTGVSNPTQGVLPQLRTRGLYPMLNAPEFHNNTGGALVGSQRITPGFQLKLQFPSTTSFNTSGTATTSQGTFYYTTDGSDPRVYYDTTGTRTPTAVAYVAPFTISATTTVKARTLNGNTWSALAEATFTVGATQPSVRITEIHYNPPAGQGGNSAEFIEIQNTGTKAVDLSNWSFDGVDFVFPAGMIIGAGDRMVFASNNAPATFAAQFPGVSVAGYFGGSLDNGGERLALNDASGKTIVSVDYDDVAPWPTSPDGGGTSLEIINPDGDPDSPFNWKASAAAKGTPGAANSTGTSPAVMISEFLATNTSAYTFSGVKPGFVELFNPSGSPVDVSNWSINAGTPTAVIIPPSTTIPNGGYLLVHFYAGALPAPSAAVALSGQQGELVLKNNSGVVIDGVHYGPQASNFSFSRIAGVWTLSIPTPGTTNTAAAAGAPASLKLNEWLANPWPGFDDWLELANTDASNPVVLTGLFLGTSTQLFHVSAPAAVSPGGYVQLICNGGSSKGNALDFQLPAEGTTLTLTDGAGTSLDTLTFGAQTEGVSQGRLPNATGPTVTLPYPSPAQANYAAIVGGPVINEILTSNLNGDNAPWARRSPWVEFKNPSGNAVDLSGWQLRNPKNPGVFWTFPASTSLPGGGYLAVWADGAQPASIAANANLNFNFPGAGNVPLSDGVELMNAFGQIVDRIQWGKQIPDLSIGRLANNTWALLTAPTRTSVNAAAANLGPASALRINEWYAASIGTDTDYVEIYNTSALPVALGGLYLSDDPSEVGRRKYKIPALSFIAGSGLTTFTADSVPPDTLFTGFSLSDTGEYLRIGLSDDTQVDALGFGLQATSSSQGRQPEGSTNTATFARTPGIANVQGTGPWFTSLPSSRVIPGGTPTTFSITAVNATSYQWRHDGAPIGGATNPTYTINAVTSNDDGSYDCVATGPGGSNPSLAATLTVLHTYTSWATEKGLTGLQAAPDADADNDGICNMAEFIANSNPLVSETLTQRLTNQVLGGVEFSGSAPAFLTLDFRLNRRASYNALQAEINTVLPGSWAPAFPSTADLISVEANGDQHWHLKYAVPGGATKSFLHLGLTP